MRTRIKICGITTPEDARHAAACGTDAIGLVFYEKSARHVTDVQAQEITQALPPFIATVGLFVDASEKFIQAVIESVPLDMLQFHGNETAAECSSYGLPYIKAVPMGDAVNLHDVSREYAEAKALLLDSHASGKAGGTGEVFDWSRVNGLFATPIILAGGLNSDNVKAAIASTQPYAVDVSSGVESKRGVKDPEKVRAFIQEVGRVNSEYAKSVRH